jgi:hypothetical protein
LYQHFCFFSQGSELQEEIFRVPACGPALDLGDAAIADVRRQRLQQGTKFRREQPPGSGRDELGEKTAQGEQGEKAIAGVIVDGADSETQLEGQVVTLAEHSISDRLEAGRGKGMSGCAGFEGIEVPEWRTGPTRAISCF